MQAVIDQYFEDCKGEPIIRDDGRPILDKYGQPFIINQRPPTVTGLALEPSSVAGLSGEERIR